MKKIKDFKNFEDYEVRLGLSDKGKVIYPRKPNPYDDEEKYYYSYPNEFNETDGRFLYKGNFYLEKENKYYKQKRPEMKAIKDAYGEWGEYVVSKEYPLLETTKEDYDFAKFMIGVSQYKYIDKCAKQFINHSEYKELSRKVKEDFFMTEEQKFNLEISLRKYLFFSILNKPCPIEIQKFWINKNL